MNNVAIWRWPNASYSTSSIDCAVIPSRDAVSRSIRSVTLVANAWASDVTSRNSGNAANLSNIIPDHLASSATSASCSVYWYWVALIRPPTWMSWRTCIKYDARNACHFLLQPRYDLGGGRTPVRERLQIDQHAALAEGPAFADPIVCIVHVGIDHHDVAETPIRSAMESNDVSGAALATPMMRPVSCCGNSPFGATA